MALKAILASLDGLSDGIKSEYREHEGKYVLDVTPVDGFELVGGGLKKALETERNTTKQLKEQAKRFENLDPDEAREAMRKVQEFANFDPEKKAAEALKEKERQLKLSLDEERKKLTDKHTQELTAEKERSKNLSAQLREHMVVTAATKAITDAKGAVPLLLPIVQSQVRMREDNGRLIAEVIGADGQSRLSPKSGSTDPMTIAELVQELAGNESYARAFDGSGASGSGASGGGAGTGGTKASFGALVLSEADSKDPVKYRAARERAHKEGRVLQIA